MAQTTITARVSTAIAAAAKQQAETEGLSLSAYVACLLADELGLLPNVQNGRDRTSERLDKIEQRLLQLEAASSRGESRRGKRRR